MQGLWDIILPPFETILTPNPTPSILFWGVSHSNEIFRKKGGVQWLFAFSTKVCYKVDNIDILF